MLNPKDKQTKQLSYNDRSENNCQGFTTIELIAVLVILGILFVVVAQKMTLNNSDLVSVFVSMKNHIRYAQAIGMNSDTVIHGIRIDAAADEYWLFSCPVGQACEWTADQTAPPGSESSPALVTPQKNRLNLGQMKVDISDIKVGTGSQSQLTLVYDRFGVPYWYGNGALTFQTPLDSMTDLKLLTDDITISLTDVDGNLETIAISFQTGFVP